MKLYHITKRAAASAIQNEGFRDSTNAYLTANAYTGVWLANRPLWIESGIELKDVACFEVALDDSVLVGEWSENWKGYREWLMPAELINKHAKRRLLTEAEFLELV